MAQTTIVNHSEPAPGSKCSFCRVGDENELAFGKLYQLGDIITHYYCLLLSSNMDQQGEDNEGVLGFLYPDVVKELKRGNRLVCVYCKRNGATIGCCQSRCKKVFHLPCGHDKGSLHQFFGQFKSFCRDHRPLQKIPPKIVQTVSDEDLSCPICLDGVDPKSVVSTIWAPCCKKNAWFHRNCLQSLAISAGYFFKCPLCCDKKVFQKAMMDFGIFIPEQDASWEMVPDAFRELLQRHNQCDARDCKCPKGRGVNEKGTRFELIMCSLCGGQASHIYCSQLQWVNPQYACETCYKYADRPKQLAPDGEEEEDEEEEEEDNEKEVAQDTEREVSEEDEKISVDDEKISVDDEIISVDDEMISVDDEKISEEDEKISVDDEKISVDDEKISVDDEKDSGGEKKVVEVGEALSPGRRSEGTSGAMEEGQVPKRRRPVMHARMKLPSLPTRSVEELVILDDSDDDDVQIVEPPSGAEPHREVVAADGSRIPVLRFSIPLELGGAEGIAVHVEGDVKVDPALSTDEVKIEGYSPGIPGFVNRSVTIRPVRATAQTDAIQPSPQNTTQHTGRFAQQQVNAQQTPQTTTQHTGRFAQQQVNAQQSPQNTTQHTGRFAQQQVKAQQSPQTTTQHTGRFAQQQVNAQQSPQNTTQHTGRFAQQVKAQQSPQNTMQHTGRFSQQQVNAQQSPQNTTQHTGRFAQQQVNAQQSPQNTTQHTGRFAQQQVNAQQTPQTTTQHTGRFAQQQVNAQQSPQKNTTQHTGRFSQQQVNAQPSSQNTTQHTGRFAQEQVNAQQSPQTTTQHTGRFPQQQVNAQQSPQTTTQHTGRFAQQVNAQQSPQNTTQHTGRFSQQQVNAQQSPQNTTQHTGRFAQQQVNAQQSPQNTTQHTGRFSQQKVNAQQTPQTTTQHTGRFAQQVNAQKKPQTTTQHTGRFAQQQVNAQQFPQNTTQHTGRVAQQQVNAQQTPQTTTQHTGRFAQQQVNAQESPQNTTQHTGRLVQQPSNAQQSPQNTTRRVGRTTQRQTIAQQSPPKTISQQSGPMAQPSPHNTMQQVAGISQRQTNSQESAQGVGKLPQHQANVQQNPRSLIAQQPSAPPMAGLQQLIPDSSVQYLGNFPLQQVNDVSGAPPKLYRFVMEPKAQKPSRRDSSSPEIVDECRAGPAPPAKRPRSLRDPDPPSYDEATRYLYADGGGAYLTSTREERPVQSVVYIPDMYGPQGTYLPEPVVAKQNLLVHHGGGGGTLVTVNQSPQTKFYLAAQPHGPAVIQNYINTMPQQQYVDGVCYASTPRYGRLQCSDNSSGPSASAAASSRSSACFGPRIASEPPGHQTKPGGGYPRLKRDTIGGVVLEILGPSHVNIHVSGKFLGNFKLTNPPVRTNDPRIVSAAKAAYKRSLSWAQPKSRSSYFNKMFKKTGPIPTEPSVPESAGNQQGIQKGETFQHDQSLGASTTRGESSGDSRPTHQVHSHSAGSGGNTMQGRSHSAGSGGNTQQGRSHSAGRVNTQQGCSHSASSGGNTHQGRSQSAGSGGNTQQGRSHRASSVKQDRSPGSRNTRQDNSHNSSSGGSTQEGRSPGSRSTRNTHQVHSQSASSGGKAQHGHSRSTSGNVRQVRSQKTNKSMLIKDEQLISLMNKKVSSQISSNSKNSLKGNKHYTEKCEETSFTCEAKSANAEKQKRAKRRCKARWSKGVIIKKNQCKRLKSIVATCAQTQSSTADRRGALSSKVDNKDNSPQYHRNEASMEPVVKRIRRMSSLPKLDSLDSINVTMTRSKISMKQYTFKMGAKNSLTTSERKSSLKRRHSQTRAMHGQSADPKRTSSPTPQRKVPTMEMCSDDESMEVLVDSSSSQDVLDMESNYLSSEDEFGSYSSSFSCESPVSYYHLGRRSMSMDTLSSYSDPIDDSRPQVVGRRGLGQDGASTSGVHLSTSKGMINTLEIDDSSHSESDIACPIFVRQRLLDNLAEDSQSPHRVIKFNMRRSSDSDDTSDRSTSILNNCLRETSFDRAQKRFERSGSVESDVSGRRGHVSRRDQVDEYRKPVGSSEASSTHNSDSNAAGHRAIRTRSRAVSELIRTRSKSRSLSRNLIKSADSFLSQQLLNASKERTPKKRSPRKSGTCSDPPPRRSTSLSRMGSAAVPGLRALHFDNLSDSTSSTSNGGPSFRNQRGCVSYKPKSKTNLFRECRQTRSHSLANHIGTRSRSRSLSNLNRKSDNSMFQILSRSKVPTPKKPTPKKCARMRPAPSLRRSKSLSRLDGTPPHERDRREPPDTPPPRRRLRRCASLSAIETSLRGLLHESDLDNLSDASSATSNRVASLKAHALTARKFRPPSQHEIEQRKILLKLQWFSNFSFSK